MRFLPLVLFSLWVGVAAPAAAQKADDGRWHGNVSGNFSAVSTAARTRSLNITVAVRRKTPNATTEVDQTYLNAQQRGAAEGARPVTTDDAWQFNGNHVYRIGDLYEGFFNARFQTDRVQELRLRSIVGGGASYFIVKRATTTLRGSIGLAAIRDDYKGAPSRNSATMEAGYRFEWAPRDGTRLTHNLTWFPNLKGMSDYYYLAQFGLEQSVSGNLFVSIRSILERDTTPAPGVPRTTSRLLLGVGTRF